MLGGETRVLSDRDQKTRGGVSELYGRELDKGSCLLHNGGARWQHQWERTWWRLRG